MANIYFMQQKIYYGHDNFDNEEIAECLIIGYFTSIDIVERVKTICIQNGVLESNIEIKKINLVLNKNQKYVYVLTHSYSIIEADGTYTDFEYIFEPQSNKTQCIQLKEKFIKTGKYGYVKGRDYSVNPPDGFTIERYEINRIFYPVCEKILY